VVAPDAVVVPADAVEEPPASEIAPEGEEARR
jgi:hypothetical protein